MLKKALARTNFPRQKDDVKSVRYIALNLEVLERVKGSSTPNPRTNKYLNFNYINYLAYISVF